MYSRLKTYLKAKILQIYFWPGKIWRIFLKICLFSYIIFVKKKITVPITLRNLRIYTRAGQYLLLSRKKMENRYNPKLRVLMGLSSQCNTKCVFCIAHSPLIVSKEKVLSGGLRQNNYGKIGKGDLLEFDTFKSVIDDLQYLGPQIIDLYDIGETLMYPRLIDAISYIKSKKNLSCTHVGMATNGLLLNDKLAKELMDKQIDSICFSLNASNSLTYKTMHFVDENVFDNVRNNIKNFIKISNCCNKRPVTMTSFVLCKTNYKELVDMVSLCASLGVKRAGFYPMYYCKGKKQKLKDYILDPNDKNHLQDIIFEALLKAKRLGITTNLKHLLKKIQSANIDSFCPKFKEAYCVQVHADGIVHPYDFPYTMGNVYERSIAHIWYSPEYTEFRNMIKEKALKGECMSTRPFCFQCNISNGKTENCELAF